MSRITPAFGKPLPEGYPEVAPSLLHSVACRPTLDGNGLVAGDPYEAVLPDSGSELFVGTWGAHKALVDASRGGYPIPADGIYELLVGIWLNNTSTDSTHDSALFGELRIDGSKPADGPNQTLGYHGDDQSECIVFNSGRRELTENQTICFAVKCLSYDLSIWAGHGYYILNRVA